jgi:CheY-like chemotaxis protein
MKPLALIIEDDPGIRDALADRLESFGHDCEAVGTQMEARERVERRTFSYILLDLELPVRFGRPPSIQIGKNLLREIRTAARNGKTPVIVVTAHGHDRPDLAVEVMRAGANHFVKKPFDNLEEAIQEAIPQYGGGDNPGPASEPEPLEKRKLGTATVAFFPDRIDLDGITICEPDKGLIWRILLLLRERKPNGQPRAFPGKRIADLLGSLRGQNAVCDAVSTFRKKVVGVLAGDGIEGDDDSVIVTGKSGYQLSPALVIEDHSDRNVDATTIKDTAAAQDRQHWFLAELAKSRKMRRLDFEHHFGISTATAKRDLRELDGKIEFIGTGAAGYYVLLPQNRG